MADEEEQKKKAYSTKPQFLIVEMSRKYSLNLSKYFGRIIDTSGIHALEELYRNLQKRDIQVLQNVLVIKCKNKINKNNYFRMVCTVKVYMCCKIF